MLIYVYILYLLVCLAFVIASHALSSPSTGNLEELCRVEAAVHSASTSSAALVAELEQHLKETSDSCCRLGTTDLRFKTFSTVFALEHKFKKKDS